MGRGVDSARLGAAGRLAGAVALASLLGPGTARACEKDLAPLPGYGRIAAPTDRLGCNLVAAGTGENLLYYGAALLSTMELSASGADHHLRVAFEERVGARGFSDATVVAGYVGPPAIGALLYGTGLVTGKGRWTGAGAAALQAMTVTFAATVLLKGLTGRPFPNHGGDPTSPERLRHPEWAREWRGPLLENSAWPSGHTSVAVSLAAALTSYYVDADWVAWVAYPAASAIALGMLRGAHHWASDVVAGALLGQAVGSSVGRDFRRMQDARESPPPTLRLMPFGAGVALVGAL